MRFLHLLALAALFAPAVASAQFVYTRVRDIQVLVDTNNLDYVGVFIPENSTSSLRDILKALDSGLKHVADESAAMVNIVDPINERITLLEETTIPALESTIQDSVEAHEASLADSRFDSGMDRWLGTGDPVFPEDSLLDQRGFAMPQRVLWGTGTVTTNVNLDIDDIIFGGKTKGYNRETGLWQIGREDCSEGDDTAEIKSLLSDAVVPIGTILNTAVTNTATLASVAPGFLLCDGAVHPRLRYPKLFAAIGTLYTTNGVASTAFQVPDLRGRFIRGAGDYYTNGVYAASYAALSNQLSSAGYHTHLGSQNFDFPFKSNTSGSATTGYTTGSLTLSQYFNSLFVVMGPPDMTADTVVYDSHPRNIALHYMIRAR